MKRHEFLLLAAIAGVLVGRVPPAMAQEGAETPAPAPAANPEIEEILVTAERREGTVQDTPVAISAYTGADLDAANYQDFEDLAFVIPNVQFGRILVGGGGITIRGVSSGTGDRATAFHVDGVYQNRVGVAQGLTFFDIRRVEVLRGPQGTLYGRNATGGSVNILSNPPSPEFEAFGDIQFGTYDQIMTRAVINVPVVEDRLMTRFSFFKETRDGFQRNDFFDSRAKDADDADTLSLRSQVRFAPIDDIDLTLRYLYSQTRGVGPGQKILGTLPDSISIETLDDNRMSTSTSVIDLYHFSSPNPKDNRRIRLDFPGIAHNTLHSMNGTFVWDLYDLPLLGDARFQVIGSYSKNDLFGQTDQDGTDADIVRVFTTVEDCDPTMIMALGTEGAGCVPGTTATTEWLVEAQLASAGGGNLDWVVGLFYLDSKVETSNIAVTKPLQFLLQPLVGELLIDVITPVATTSTTTADSIAVFGQTTYHFGRDSSTFWDDWSLTGGLRYTRDRKRLISMSPAVELPGIGEITPMVDVDDEDSWDSFTGEGRLEWRWSDDNLVYFKASRGYKAGEIESAIGFDNAEPEYIWAYEAGSKNRFFDNRLQANLTAFYYDYQNLQVSTLVELVVATQNAAEATIWGLEAEFVALPFAHLDFARDLQLLANVSYLKATYDEFTCQFPEEEPLFLPDSDGILHTFAINRDCSGNTLPRAPRWSLTLVGEYPLDLGRFGTLTPRLQFFVSDDVFFRPFNCPNAQCDEVGVTASDLQERYTKTDVMVTWRSQNRKFWVQGFVENLSDNDVIQSQVTSTRLIGSLIQTRFDEPRTAGVRLGLAW